MPQSMSVAALTQHTQTHDERTHARIKQAPVEPDTLALAWSYFTLALLTLRRACARQLALHPDFPNRLYLLANVALYGAFGLLVLFGPQHLVNFQTGSMLVVSLPARLFWGIGDLLVAAAQFIPLLRLHERRVMSVYVLTAVWAGALLAVTGIVAVEFGGDWSRPIAWGWVLVLHLLFVRYRLVPIDVDYRLIHRLAELLGDDEAGE